MKENVAVNTGIPKYYPKFENPLFLAAKKQELRNEALKRIKEGNFESLSTLLSQVNLTPRELGEILLYWNENNATLMEIYYESLRNNDLNKIALADTLYQQIKLQTEEEVNKRK